MVMIVHSGPVMEPGLQGHRTPSHGPDYNLFNSFISCIFPSQHDVSADRGPSKLGQSYSQKYGAI